MERLSFELFVRDRYFHNIFCVEKLPTYLTITPADYREDISARYGINILISIGNPYLYEIYNQDRRNALWLIVISLYEF